MMSDTLSQSVQRLASVTQEIPDPKLDRAWAWKDYNSEGVRFAFFRTYEELRELAVKLRQERVALGLPPTSAQLILAQYHAAYCDLQSAFLGARSELVNRAPAENEWPVRTVLSHIVEADVGFYVVIRYALDGYRAGEARPAKLSDEEWDAIAGKDEAAIRSLRDGPFDGMRTYHGTLHERVLREFAEIKDEEMEAPCAYWEAEPMSLRFRLHRLDSHMRQHTIQIDKTLVRLGYEQTEARRLLRLIYAALAQVEGVLIGTEGIGDDECRALAESIRSRTDEIGNVLGLHN